MPAPSTSLLADDAAQAWARATAAALVSRTVPAVAHPARRGDWRLVLSAQDEGADVVPSYAIENPAGKTQGTITGAPVPTAALGRWRDRRRCRRRPRSRHRGSRDLLTSIEAARRESDPNSLINRPARILVPEVKGAPGDGDFSLAREMRVALPKNGEVVQDTKPGTDYTVQGLVHTAPGAAGTTRIEIQWVVTDAPRARGGACGADQRGQARLARPLLGRRGVGGRARGGGRHPARDRQPGASAMSVAVHGHAFVTLLEAGTPRRPGPPSAQDRTA